MVIVKRECSNKLLNSYGQHLWLYDCFAIAQNQDEKGKPTHCSQGALDDDKVGVAHYGMSLKPIK